MKIYLIGGKARNGKDTLASFMKEELEQTGKKPCIMHLGNYIKHYAKDYFGWDGNDETKPRSLLQQLGTDIIRGKLNKQYFFINRLLEDIEVLSYFFDSFIVADLRLPLEFEEIKKQYPDSIRIHIKRINHESELSDKEKSHITEVALDEYDSYDYKIVNETLEKLALDAKRIVKEEEYEKNDE